MCDKVPQSTLHQIHIFYNEKLRHCFPICENYHAKFYNEHWPRIGTDPLSSSIEMIYVVKTATCCTTFLPTFGEICRTTKISQNVDNGVMTYSVTNSTIVAISWQQGHYDLPFNYIWIIRLRFAQIEALIWNVVWCC